MRLLNIKIQTVIQKIWHYLLLAKIQDTETLLILCSLMMQKRFFILIKKELSTE